MIVRSKSHWLRMLFVWRGSVLHQVVPQLLGVLAVSLFATWTKGHVFGMRVPLTIAPFTLLGVSLAVFLGFRNSASYDRYWEGRKLWGNLVNVNRSLVRQALTLTSLRADDERASEWVGLLSAFTHALRHQLRHTDPSDDLTRLLGPARAEKLQKAQFRPAMVLLLLAEWVHDRRREGDGFGEITAAAFDTNLGHLSDVLGGCERLSSTPLPYPYSLMILRTVYIYCFLLPFALVDSAGAMTAVLAVLTAYTFMALEALAEELEEPFGTSANDLPLESLSWTIESTLLEMIGKPTLEAKKPNADFVLN